MGALTFRFLEDGAQTAADVVATITSFIASAQHTSTLPSTTSTRAGRERRHRRRAGGGAGAGRGGPRRVQRGPQRRSRGAPGPGRASPRRSTGSRSPRAASRTRARSCTTSTWSGRRGASSPARRTGPTTPSRARRTSSCELHAPVWPPRTRPNFEAAVATQRQDRTGSRGPTATMDHGVTVTPCCSLPTPPSAAHRHGRTHRRGEAPAPHRSPVVTSGTVLGTLAEFAGGRTSTWPASTTPRRWKRSSGSGQRCRGTSGRSRPGTPSRGASRARCPPRTGPARSTTTCTRSPSLPTTRSLVGSYNLSRGGEENAENVLHVVNEEVAVNLSAFADRLAARYAGPTAAVSSAAGHTDARGHQPQ